MKTIITTEMEKISMQENNYCTRIVLTQRFLDE